MDAFALNPRSECGSVPCWTLDTVDYAANEPEFGIETPKRILVVIDDATEPSSLDCVAPLATRFGCQIEVLFVTNEAQGMTAMYGWQ